MIAETSALIRIKIAFLVTGIMSAITGILYLVQVYGTSEPEVGPWALLSVVAGVLPTILALIPLRNNWMAWGAIMAFALLIIFQILAISLWLGFHMVSDQSVFVPQARYALPHIIIALLSMWSIYELLHGKKDIFSSSDIPFPEYSPSHN